MKIYTRTGDGGETSLFGGPRVPKNDLRVAAYGDVDELNASLGVVTSELASGSPLFSEVEQIQRDLFGVGAELATATERAREKLRGLVQMQEVERLESSIDRMEESLPRLTSFILPGGSRLGAKFHVARTVCRRAERSILTLEKDGLRPELLAYMNRLADWLFVAARFANQSDGQSETTW